ncbi:PQQ-binding-like beta-propeller repeat protein [Candidatus Pelagibacter bacterium nBUS_32]|uniref:PQQ-binding-like beta-propeller repeat protein n=1 Tax=Candidatus Pelagibacter bacterium nBUS_32 TaxID=3374192 RepID=UPI003EBAB30D
MNRFIILIISLVILSHCSLNENSRLWQDKEKNVENKKNIIKVFSEEKKITTEFNQQIKLDLKSIESNNKITSNKNNYGSQDYNGLVSKIGNYKFSKLDDINQLDLKPVFLDDGLIFFDKKGSIIRYNNSQKVLWKKNYYSKSEKKLKPKLNFVLEGENLLVTDNIAKYYSVNINSSELNWSKNNTYPFNSEIKKNKNKIFVVDYKNTLRCYDIDNGSECWNLQTEDSFTISNSKLSLIIVDEMVIFSNSIGDITAVDIVSGLITWQLPTQSSNIINETYNFKVSKLVSDGKSIFFSNNKNEFYSVDVKTGTTNWINKINSNLTPITTGNLIFTVSNDGYLHVIEKNKGNIVRITDLYKNYKIKKRKDIKPVGFAIGDLKIYLTNSDGKMIIADLSLGDVISTEKITGNFISRPFIFNQNLFVIRNGSIIQYN